MDHCGSIMTGILESGQQPKGLVYGENLHCNLSIYGRYLPSKGLQAVFLVQRSTSCSLQSQTAATNGISMAQILRELNL